jgi:hypothetical protein
MRAELYSALKNGLLAPISRRAAQNRFVCRRAIPPFCEPDFRPNKELSLRTNDSAAARGLPVARLMLGMLVTALLVMAQQGHFATPEKAVSSYASLVHLNLAPVSPPVGETHSSAAMAELAMGPKQLLERWNPLIEDAARRFHVPAAWLKAVMRQESGGRTVAADGKPISSSAGALGVMQLMPATYREMAAQYGLGDDPADPHDNIFAAAGYLRWLKAKYGYPAMFAAYNDGPGHYEDHLKGRALPEETQNYVKAIAGHLGTAVENRGALARLTRPDGALVAVDASRVSGIRPVLPGEYPDGVNAVVKLGQTEQAVRETVTGASDILRRSGAPV